ncbi:MAG TPA: hypothetical protein VIQ77_03960 [Mucilaginibacter sp.]
MYNFGHLYLSWRKGSGYPRHIVGIIKIKKSGINFSYIKHSVEEAKKDGFIAYTEFPEIDKIYTENVIDTFAQRLIKTDRGDISNFLNFWQIPAAKADDKIYLMAHTQAWMPTDNFEILAEFNPSKKLCFVTDLAGLSITRIPSDVVSVGDVLTFKRYPLYEDKYAVEVYKGPLFLGYIKKIHNRVFDKNGSHNLSIKITAIERNGIVKRIFVKIAS